MLCDVQFTVPTRCLSLIASACLVGVSAFGQSLPTDEPPPDLAVADSESPFSLSVYWENDSRLTNPFDPDDRHYTNGLLLNFGYKPQWAESLAPNMPFAESFGSATQTRTGAGFILGHEIHTPDDITIPGPQPDQRPYAGYLYAGGYWQRDNLGEGEQPGVVPTLDHFQINLGLVGPSSLAEELQENIHNWFNGDDPRGWDNQLSDEPVIQGYFRKSWRFDGPEVSVGSSVLEMQLIPELDAALGTVDIYGQVGVLGRIGFNLPDDFGPGDIHHIPSVTGLNSRHNGWRPYIFGRVAGRAVAHNMLLEGNNYEDSLGVDAEPFVGLATVGAWLTYEGDNWAIDYLYSLNFITEEFDGQDGLDTYGTFMLAWRYDY